jgi:hypothetical protein
MDQASYPIICTDCTEPFHIVQMRLQSETWECPECQIIALYDEPENEYDANRGHNEHTEE